MLPKMTLHGYWKVVAQGQDRNAITWGMPVANLLDWKCYDTFNVPCK